MQDTNSQIVVILLFSVLGLLILTALLLFRILRHLRRIEQSLENPISSYGTYEPPPSPVETAAGGAFETFLSEDASRRSLSKGEQFSAYRQWRQERGLNWSKS